MNTKNNQNRKPNNRWYKLDNAAKIVPSQARGTDTRVFRLTCCLNEDIDEAVLQDALNHIMPEFPLFGCILKRGLFWYYLEASDILPKVTEENLPALTPIYFPGRKNLLFRVLYYRNRINLEVFHVLADGTGAFLFLRKLVAEYLQLKHGLPPQEIGADDESSTEEKESDAFDSFYEKSTGLSQLKEMQSARAWQVRGELDEDLQGHLLEIRISASEFLKKAREYHTTVGVLTVALYMASCIDCMSLRQRKNPIVVSVPVNLRQYFHSDTTRNFFGVINISFFAENYHGDFQEILDSVQESFNKQLTEEKIRETMNSYAALEHNFAVKMIPLFLKDIGIAFFSRTANRGVTCTMSNLGQIRMPEIFTPYISHFTAFMSAPSEQICVSSFGDNLMIGEVSPYETHGVMLNFVRRLSGMSISVTLASNDYDREEDDK